MIQNAKDFDDERCVIKAIHRYKYLVYKRALEETNSKESAYRQTNRWIERDLHELRRTCDPHQLRAFLARIITQFNTNSATDGPGIESFLRFYNSSDPEYMRDIMLLGFSSQEKKKKKTDDSLDSDPEKAIA